MGEIFHPQRRINYENTSPAGSQVQTVIREAVCEMTGAKQ